MNMQDENQNNVYDNNQDNNNNTISKIFLIVVGVILLSGGALLASKNVFNGSKNDSVKIDSSSKDDIQEPSIIEIDSEEVEVEIQENDEAIAKITSSTSKDKKTKWTSSNPDVVTVDSNGKVKAKKIGSAVITATTDDETTFTATITVIEEIEVEKIEITNASYITKGEQKTLKVAITPTDARNGSVTWTSSDPGIVKIDSSGKITGLKEGTATITAKSENGKTATANIKVLGDNTRLEIRTTANDVKVGNSISLTAYTMPSNELLGDVTWTSSDTSIAKIDSTGKLTGVKEGTVTITAKSKNGKTAMISIKVLADNITLEIKAKKNKIKISESVILSAYIMPNNELVSDVIWTTSDSSIAKINSSGKVTGVKPGTVTITAKTSNGFSAAYNINVVTVAVSSISFTNANIGIKLKDSSTLQPTIEPSDTTDKTIKWTSSNTDVATVDSNGIVKGLKAGTVKITAETSNGKKAYVSVKVYNPNKESLLNFFFLNTQTYNGMNYTSNESILIQSIDNKYLLYDAADNDDKIVLMIYNRLKTLQKTSVVTIDYLVISHLHSDHYGSAMKILKNKNIVVKNLIIKKVSNSSDSNNVDKYNKIVNANSNVKVNQHKNNTIALGNFTDIYFYNNPDVYANKDCSATGKVVKYSRRCYTDNSVTYIKADNKYICFTGADYLNALKNNTKVTYSLKDNCKDTRKKSFEESLFCAYQQPDERAACSENANSLAMLVDVKSKTHRYAYIAGDLDNTGYPISGDSSIGTGGATLYKNFTFNTQTNSFTEKKGIVKVRNEDSVAKNIVKRLGNDTSKIVIYQQSHHGINNNSVDILGLNRSDLYAIACTATDGERSGSFLSARGYYFLNKTNYLRTGYKDSDGNIKQGIKCYIKYDDTYSCNYY